jgi:hypothetical protein
MAGAGGYFGLKSIRLARQRFGGPWPKVMDNLMPHMVKEVVPLVSGPLVRYLQGKAKTPAQVGP